MILTTIILTLLIGLICVIGLMMFVFGGGFLLIFGDFIIFGLVVYVIYVIVKLIKYFTNK